MRPIRVDGGLAPAFEARATRNRGDVEESSDATLFCEFPPTED